MFSAPEAVALLPARHNLAQLFRVVMHVNLRVMHQPLLRAAAHLHRQHKEADADACKMLQNFASTHPLDGAAAHNTRHHHMPGELTLQVTQSRLNSPT